MSPYHSSEASLETSAHNPSPGSDTVRPNEFDADEHAPFLHEALQEGDPEEVNCQTPPRITRRLYLSHFLSTWNSRVFEFGAVLYLASIYPQTLLPLSVYASARCLSAILFASAVGQYIDTGNRLQVVRVSIVLQRAVVTISCMVFYILATRPPHQRDLGVLAILAFLACIEKLCSIMNLVSVEKDWVVVVAGDNQTALRNLNAQMRRIDLICKLVGPLFIGLFDGISTKAAILINLAMNISSVIIEYFAIASVYHEVRQLQQPKTASRAEPRQQGNSRDSESRLMHNWRHVQSMAKKSAGDLNTYFHHRAFLPSMACALLYLTVLSFAGQMVTYLLSAGFTAIHIGIARAASVIFEVSSTWLAPWLMSKIGPVRAGLWLSSWQVIMLIAGVTVFWAFSDKPVVAATGIVVGTILSRVGLIGFDLCTQFIVQEDVEAESRGAFSSIEAAWQNAFELLSYTLTIIFFRPRQFRWPALISVIAVTSASLVYTVFVYLRRGHLLHFGALARCLCPKKNDEEPAANRERLDERDI